MVIKRKLRSVKIRRKQSLGKPRGKVEVVYNILEKPEAYV